MRPLVLLLAVAFFAGCASSGPGPAVGPSSSPAPQGGHGGNGTSGTPGFTPLHWTHDYAQPDETRNFTVYAAWGALNLHAYVDGPQGIPVCSGDFQIEVRSPDGTASRVGSSSQVETGGAHCQGEIRMPAGTPGTWWVAFKGSGTGTGVLDLSKA